MALGRHELRILSGSKHLSGSPDGGWEYGIEAVFCRGWSMVGASFSFPAERGRLSLGEAISVALRKTRQPSALLFTHPSVSKPIVSDYEANVTLQHRRRRRSSERVT